MPRGGGLRGGGGFGGRGFGMRRVGVPLLGMGGYGGYGGSSLLGTLMAGGLGYMMGSNSTQQQQIPQPMQPYPYQGQPATPQGQPTDANSSKLAQLKQLGDLRESGTLTDDEFEREKQSILHS